MDKVRIKKCLYFLFKIIALPFFIFFLILSKIFGKRRGFTHIMQWASILPGFCGEFFRKALLGLIIGDNLIDCYIGFMSTFSDPRIKIGKGVYIGPKCDIGHVEIGKDVLIGTGVHILSGINQHCFKDVQIPIKEQGGEFNKIVIGEDVWIGNGSIIGADIGKGAVIGAGSVVIKPVPEFAIVAGNPAKILKFRK